MIATVAPGHSETIKATYDLLLGRAISAHLGLVAQADPDHPLVLRPPMESGEPSAFDEHALTRTELLTLLPPSPNLATEQLGLLRKATESSVAITRLEFKLRAAGASDRTIERAIRRRADASAAITSQASIANEANKVVESLGERLLEYAESVTADVTAFAEPAFRHQPADAIFGRLMQQRPNLAQLDTDAVLDGDGDIILGYLCELSDRCLFSWREV